MYQLILTVVLEPMTGQRHPYSFGAGTTFLTMPQCTLPSTGLDGARGDLRLLASITCSRGPYVFMRAVPLICFISVMI